MSQSQPHWAKNFSSSHNVYFDFPPLMNDGRNFSGWQPGNAVNESIRRSENIKSNWDYRRYLTTNADQIMTLNRIDAVNMSGHGSFEVSAYEQENQRNVPFMYASVMDSREPFGYVQSDLKDTYLSRESLQARMVAPEITQEQILEFQRQQKAGANAQAQAQGQGH
jgi:hypothetical protein